MSLRVAVNILIANSLFVSLTVVILCTVRDNMSKYTGAAVLINDAMKHTGCLCCRMS